MMGHMATFVLTSCRFRDGWLVPFRGSETIELNWEGLRKRLAPSRSASALRALKMLVPNAYVGVRRRTDGQLSSFVVRNPNMSGDIRNLVRQDPSFAESIVEVYRVDRAEWDARMIEPETVKSRT